MPISTKIDPFSKQPVRKNQPLRTPQARVLAALMPAYPEDPVSEWPLVNRPQLGIRAGYTSISGTVTRALNGIRAGSSSGDPHPGLLALGYVEEVPVSLDGVTETNYRATRDGIKAYQDYLALNNKLPTVRPASICTNDRYRKEESNKELRGG